MKSFIATTFIFSICLIALTTLAFVPAQASCENDAADCVGEGLEVTAKQADLDTSKNATNLPLIIGRVINYFFGIIGVIALTVTLIGGYEWMTAGGNEEKVAKGKKFITNGVNGLIVIFLAYALVYVIMISLGRATSGTN